ncbi:MAG: hypothetical protein GKR93_12005 [Gammaproteobacteria bacterium]|nr:hypothetical protein [Gammaproteobacteria bacterium]
MIPGIRKHFIDQAKDRAPWLLDLECLSDALNRAWVGKRENNTRHLIKHDFHPTTYLIVPKTPTKHATVIVISSGKLHTVYEVKGSWAERWLSKTPETKRKRYHYGA